ncbi:MAG: YqiA/YcfP family alpha/beta fold hydrolase [Promethearchaeota archaeon]
MHILYLYGFASGPQSNKAQFFKEKFNSLDVPFDIFDYIPNRESFSNLKTSKLLENLHSYIELNYTKETDIVLFGSSFGAFLSVWYTSKHPERVQNLILIAPALRFSAHLICETHGINPSLWEKQGLINVFHYRYNGEIPLKYTFYEDLVENPLPDFDKVGISIPILILHGKSDNVVPIIGSKQFADSNRQVTLHELNGDHQLLDQKDAMWDLVKDFLGI